MAVWQWTIYLVPRIRVNEFDMNSGCRLSSDEFDSIAWWVEEYADCYVDFFDDKLVRDDRPYAKNQISWGNIDKSDVSIGINGQMLEYISVRIDARDPADFLSTTIDLADTFDLWLYDYNAEILVSPDKIDVHRAFNNSKAVQFTKEPVAFFNDSKYLDDINRKNKARL